MKKFEESIILLIDSVLPELTVGVIHKGTVTFRHSPHQRCHDKHINILVRELMCEKEISFSDIDFYAVVAGPGSWTGCRVGVTAVKGFCAAVPKPVIVLNTLNIISYEGSLPAALHSHSDIYYVERKGVCTSERLSDTKGYTTLDTLGKNEYLNNMISCINDSVKKNKITEARTLVPIYITDFEIKS